MLYIEKTYNNGDVFVSCDASFVDYVEQGQVIHEFVNGVRVPKWTIVRTYKKGLRLKPYNS